MTEGLITPIDHLSGLPLSILSADESASRFSPDLHHPFHPKKDPLLEGLGGQALRHCRVQRVRYETHHYDYHQNYEGPELPTTDAERFRLVVMATAGYIPRQALALHKNREPRIVDFSERARAHYLDTRRIRVETIGKVQKFLRNYVLEQDMSEISESTLDEFLTRNNDKRRLELGDIFLGVAARQATNPIKDMYIEAHRARLIPQQTNRASRFVLSSLCLQKDRHLLHNQLIDRLAA